MQGLRPKHYIHKRRPFLDSRAFLAGDTAANANNHLGALIFNLAPFTQSRKYFFLRFFAYRAGIQQQHIGLFWVINQFKSM